METTNKRKDMRRRGQTLAEFSLTLPILLLLTFGTIEMGRLFQAWVTIQNAAREATRYTTTGTFDDEKYDLDTTLPCDTADLRGGVQREAFGGGPVVEFYADNDGAGNFTLAEESLFATFYDGTDCDPTIADHETMRRDILRLASIMEVARTGAGGLSLEANRLDGSAQAIFNNMVERWTLPRPRADQRGYFDVMICSTRPFLNPDSEEVDPLNEGLRFVTIREPSDVPTTFDNGFETPFCMLNERQPASTGAADNGGVAWLDPGGPGQRVTVVVRFNHPLITPLGLADYVTMRAQRSGVNETFRTSNAVNAALGAPPGAGEFDTPTPLPPTDTPPPTSTATHTETNTPTPTNTATFTPTAFDCADMSVSNLQIFGQRVYIDIQNNNDQDTRLDRVYLNWRTPTEYPGMYLSSQSVNSEVFWFGERNVAPFDTAVDLNAEETDRFLAADRSIPGMGDVSVWEGLYLGAGFNLVQIGMNQWDWGGSRFYFFNPSTGASDCEVTLELPPVPAVTDTPESLDTATATFTPDCASDSVSIDFTGFDTFGVVMLEVTNNRYQTAPLLGFDVNWPHPVNDMDPDQDGVLTLRKISAGGSDADDFGQPDSEGVLIWRGREDWGDGFNPGDREPTTTHTEGSFWRDNYVFPPRSRTTLFLDFEGTPSTLSNAFGIGAWQFNGTFFDIDCDQGGPGDGPGDGGGNDGSIFISEIPQPPPTRTPGPTDTPGPTLTPSPTRPSPTPSNTWTPGPSRTPSNTPIPTDTPLPQRPTRVPTQDGGGSE